MSLQRTLLVSAMLWACGAWLTAEEPAGSRAFDLRHNFMEGSATAAPAVETPPTSAPPISQREDKQEAESVVMPAPVVERAERQNRAWDSLSAKLNQPVTIRSGGVTTRAAVEEIARQIEAPIRFDARAMEEEGLTVDDETGPLDIVHRPAITAFERLLSDYDLDLVVEGEVLVATTAARAEEHLWTRVYPVHDFVTGDSERKIHEATAALMNAIQQTTTGPWLDIDGTGGTLVPLFYDGSIAIIVRQTDRNQREIEKLLHDLRKARRATKP